MRTAVVRLAAASFIALLWAGCGGGGSSNPVAPSSTWPNVAGYYTGSVTINYTTLGLSLTCGASTTVNQSGSSVSFAPLTFSGTGSCATLGSVPVGNGTIDANGSLGSASQTNIYLASCNGYYNGSSSGGFFGSQLQFSYLFTPQSGACVNSPGVFSLTGTLNRQ